jgi:hypothetical protein
VCRLSSPSPRPIPRVTPLNRRHTPCAVLPSFKARHAERDCNRLSSHCPGDSWIPETKSPIIVDIQRSDSTCAYQVHSHFGGEFAHDADGVTRPEMPSRLARCDVRVEGSGARSGRFVGTLPSKCPRDASTIKASSLPMACCLCYHLIFGLRARSMMTRPTTGQDVCDHSRRIHELLHGRVLGSCRIEL